MGYNAVYCIETQPTVSEEHIDTIMRALLGTCFHAGFLVGLFFDIEDGDAIFLRNVG
jgi:hypothetical protein